MNTIKTIFQIFSLKNSTKSVDEEITIIGIRIPEIIDKVKQDSINSLKLHKFIALK